MKHKSIKFSAQIIAFFSALVLQVGCDTENPTALTLVDIGVEKVILELTNASTGATTIYQWDNSSSDSAASSATDTLRLAEDITYNGRLAFTDNSDADLSIQVEQNPEAFQVFYSFSGVDSLTLTITDEESDYEGGNQNGEDLAVGLKFEMIAHLAPADVGVMVITLYHYATVAKTGVDSGDEVYFEIGIPLTVQN